MAVGYRRLSSNWLQSRFDGWLDLDLKVASPVLCFIQRSLVSILATLATRAMGLNLNQFCHPKNTGMPNESLSKPCN
jgi:hypothetical protein